MTEIALIKFEIFKRTTISEDITEPMHHDFIAQISRFAMFGISNLVISYIHSFIVSLSHLITFTVQFKTYHHTVWHITSPWKVLK